MAADVAAREDDAITWLAMPTTYLSVICNLTVQLVDEGSVTEADWSGKVDR